MEKFIIMNTVRSSSSVSSLLLVDTAPLKCFSLEIPMKLRLRHLYSSCHTAKAIPFQHPKYSQLSEEHIYALKTK